MWKVNRWQTTNDGRKVIQKAHIAFGKVSWKEYQNVNTYM